jgi:hypothetical protein
MVLIAEDADNLGGQRLIQQPNDRFPIRSSRLAGGTWATGTLAMTPSAYIPPHLQRLVAERAQFRPRLFRCHLPAPSGIIWQKEPG